MAQILEPSGLSPLHLEDRHTPLGLTADDLLGMYRTMLVARVLDQRVWSLNRMGRALGILIADLVNIFNLPMYVIGGGVANAWDAFSPALLDEALKRSYIYKATAPQGSVRGQETKLPDESSSRPSTIITHASLGSDAGLIGAARLPMMG